MRLLPKALFIYWKNILFLALLFSVFRFIFFIAFRDPSQNLPTHDLINAFVTGFRFDLRLAVFCSLPLLVFALFRQKWIAHHLKVWCFFYTGLSFIILSSYATDLGYFAYLESRINITALNLLNHIPTAVGMIWQSYNIPLITFGILTTCYLQFLLYKKIIFTDNPSTAVRLWPWKLASFLATALLIHGSLNQFPLRWSDAFFSSNNFISHLTLNPILYFADSALSVNTSYDIDRTKAFYPAMAQYLGIKDQNAESLNFHRPLVTSQLIPKNFNIVYIVMESFAAYKTGQFGNSLNASPYFDNLSKSGVLFKNFYTPTEGTARSMFCALTGIPDINAESTSSRNPQVVDQQTLVSALTEHDKYYFIGGSASWGNIRGVYQNNIENLKMYEGKDFSLPSTDVWGLSDLDLFKEAARILKDRDKKKPFFAMIQSASFHRPFTIPDKREDFKTETPTPEQIAEAGFYSLEEYNSFRFSDYSLGHFFELIKDSDFANNTLFVIHGDHGLPHNEAANLSKGSKHYGLNRFHVPLLFYAPEILKPDVRDDMSMEPDVMATLVGATGHEATNTTFGRNLLADKPKEDAVAFTYVYYAHPLELMLIDKNKLLVATPDKIKGLYEFNSENYETDLRDKYPDDFARMSQLVHGFYESSRYLLHHNPKLKSRK